MYMNLFSFATNQVAGAVVEWAAAVEVWAPTEVVEAVDHEAV